MKQAILIQSMKGKCTRRVSDGQFGAARAEREMVVGPHICVVCLSIYPLLASGRTSSGKRYSSPAFPKFTRIRFRPRFSIARTKVPCRGKRIPVFCDRIGLIVFSGSPGLMVPSVVWFRAVRPLFIPRRLLNLTIGTCRASLKPTFTY